MEELPIDSKIQPVASRPSKRRRFTKEQKLTVAEETYQVGASVSIVARKHGISPSQVFNWRRDMENGKYQSQVEGNGAVTASEIKGYKERIRRLERLLGQKTEDIEILREAVKIGREKKLISRALLPGEKSSS